MDPSFSFHFITFAEIRKLCVSGQTGPNDDFGTFETFFTFFQIPAGILRSPCVFREKNGTEKIKEMLTEQGG